MLRKDAQLKGVPGEWHKLDRSFFGRKDVVKIAKELMGKILLTHFDGKPTAGRIVEVEAYNGIMDKASHAYDGRRTARTEVMYSQAATSYVYLCYGIHHLFNIVTNTRDVPHAILIRGIEPLLGTETMLERTHKPRADSTLTRGPGNVSKALGIFTHHTGRDMDDAGAKDLILVMDDGFRYKPSDIKATKRIGVDYAAEDSLLPYRFIVKSNPYVSGKKS